MLKQALKEKGVVINDNIEFTEIMRATTDDIKFNNINFKRRTSFNDVINIAVRAAATLKRCV